MSFLGLDIALSGLRAQQYAMDVTAHNIANAGTAGYHRQVAVLVSGNGASASAGEIYGQLGTGVIIQGVRRMQSEYIGDQVRTATQWLGMWNSKNEALTQVESIFSEPGDSGLAATMDQFWNSWQDLSTSPADTVARISVVENGVALSDRIRGLYRDLRGLQATTDRDIVDNTTQVNRLAHEIAALNNDISEAKGTGGEPNDLMDRRDLLLNELANIADIQTNGDNASELIVAINGKVLIQGNKVTEVAVTQDADGWSRIIWSNDGSPVEISGGEIAGQIQVRDDLIEGYIQSLDTIARTIVDRVNALHSTGVTSDGQPAGNFFTANSGAADMSVESTIASDPSGVATSTTGQSGDNSLARAIAAVADEKLIGGETIGSAYSGLIARLGANTRAAGSSVDLHTASLQQLKTQGESLSGVSLDEEMLNMVKFQQAYNAAARVITVLNDMLDTLMNQAGA